MTHPLEDNANHQLMLFDTNAGITNAGITTVTNAAVSPTTNAAISNDNIVAVNPPRLPGVPYSQFCSARQWESENGLQDMCPF